jgi:hypothetical protein
VLRIVSVQVLAGDRVSLRFSHAPNRDYAVEATSDFTTWAPLEGGITYVEKGVADWIGPLPFESMATPGFLRVRVQ